jgi:hypothetical protein
LLPAFARRWREKRSIRSSFMLIMNEEVAASCAQKGKDYEAGERVKGKRQYQGKASKARTRAVTRRAGENTACWWSDRSLWCEFAVSVTEREGKARRQARHEKRDATAFAWSWRASLARANNRSVG